MTQSFRDSNLHRIVEGIPSPIHVPDGAGVRVDERATADRRRPQIAGGSLGRHDHIGVVDAEWLVHTTRAYIPDHRGQIPCDFALYIQVPLHDVITVGLVFNVRIFQGSSAKA